MHLLAIDTAHGRCSTAISTAGKPLAFTAFNTPSKQAETLVGLVDSALEEAALSYQQLTHVAVCIGPGSFTGLRIGIAAAQGICFSRNIPLIGITSLEAIAENYTKAHSDAHPFAVSIHAQRGQAYLQLFRDALTPLSEGMLVSLDAIATQVKAWKANTLTGNCKAFIEAADIAITEDIFYDARNVAEVALKKIQGEKELPPATPFYIRPPDAKLPKPRQ